MSEDQKKLVKIYQKIKQDVVILKNKRSKIQIKLNHARDNEQRKKLWWNQQKLKLINQKIAIKKANCTTLELNLMHIKQQNENRYQLIDNDLNAQYAWKNIKTVSDNNASPTVLTNKLPNLAIENPQYEPNENHNLNEF